MWVIATTATGGIGVGNGSWGARWALAMPTVGSLFRALSYDGIGFRWSNRSAVRAVPIGYTSIHLTPVLAEVRVYGAGFTSVMAGFFRFRAEGLVGIPALETS